MIRQKVYASAWIGKVRPWFPCGGTRPRFRLTALQTPPRFVAMTQEAELQIPGSQAGAWEPANPWFPAFTALAIAAYGAIMQLSMAIGAKCDHVVYRIAATIL